METPTLEEFKAYAEEKILQIGDNPKHYSEWILIKYMTWDSDQWHKNPKGKRQKIKNWKTTLLSCLPYREPNKNKNSNQSAPLTVTQMLRNKHGIA